MAYYWSHKSPGVYLSSALWLAVLYSKCSSRASNTGIGRALFPAALNLSVHMLLSSFRMLGRAWMSGRIIWHECLPANSRESLKRNGNSYWWPGQHCAQRCAEHHCDRLQRPWRPSVQADWKCQYNCKRVYGGFAVRVLCLVWFMALFGIFLFGVWWFGFFFKSLHFCRGLALFGLWLVMVRLAVGVKSIL